eukprot:Phypoly_transcript_05120.p1 GENE.Phypoly_transcript_05120~~Phypoly_transcript_05120.p1  ORF type:complete len:614 (-),score=69.72 Phypoly_transcript_05120:12-1853(-)
MTTHGPMPRFRSIVLLLVYVFAGFALGRNDYLPMDTAQLRFNSITSNYTHIELWGQSTECYKCSLIPLCIADGVPPLTSAYNNISTQWPWHIQMRLGVKGAANYNVVDLRYDFGEHGVYTVTITDDRNPPIYLLDDSLPGNAYLALIVASCILGALAVLWPATLLVYRRLNPSKRALDGSRTFDEKTAAKKKKRVVSLDVFRGMCITIMIFVNYGGGGYWFFNHSLWNGLTVADLVFPWFIFIMGVAMPLSFQALQRQEKSSLQILYKIVRRSIILFALGMFINDGANILFWRIPGVLQRFAVAYLVTGIVIVFVPTLGTKQAPEENLEETDNLLHNSPAPLPKYIRVAGRLVAQFPRSKYKSSFFPFALHWAFALTLVAMWTIITFLLPVPGCPRGYIGPGGLSDNSAHWNCTGGAAGYIDKVVFGENHIYGNPTCKDMYDTGAYDPEGLLGNLTSIFLCFLGVLAGRVLQVHTVPIKRILRWGGWGIVFCGLAALLCKMSQNDGWIPINKNLWSASFVFLMGGGGFLVFTATYMLVDVWRVWNGAPFIYVGMNSITIYLGSETLGNYFPFMFYTSHSYAHHSLTLASNLIGTASWVFIAFMMFRNNFFVNI